MKNNIFKLDNPRVWRTYTGGKCIDLLHGINGEDSHYPEEWIMSITKARNADNDNDGSDGLSRLENGKSLLSLIESNSNSFIGKNIADTGVLIKLIDSSERLGIQVHPDKKCAKELFNSEYGKTECWYILDTRTINGIKPSIYLGFKKGITKDYWRSLFDKQDTKSMLDCLECFEVKKGDTFLVEGGTPHAIGSGCFLCEIQEPTDYTIRTEKVTPSGFAIDDRLCHQGIGFDKMFDVFHYDGYTRNEILDRWHIKSKVIFEDKNNKIIQKIGYDKTPCFSLEELSISTKFSINTSNSFYGLYVISGEGCIKTYKNSISIKKGDQFFVPINCVNYVIHASKHKPLRILRFFGPNN